MLHCAVLSNVRVLALLALLALAACGSEERAEPVNQLPIARFAVASNTGVAPFTVRLDATQSTDPDGSIVRYTWDLGDGSTSNNSILDQIYRNPGTYTITLTVEDDDGATSSQSTTITVTQLVSTRFWSDPATWGGRVPQDGESVTIPSGDVVTLDVDTAQLGGLTINGTLTFAHRDLELTADWIMVHGRLEVGTEAVPYVNQAVITLTGDDVTESVMGMGTRGIMVMGGELDLHGLPPTVPWLRLGASASGGAREILVEGVTIASSSSTSREWLPGDEIVIAPTDYFGVGETEAHRIETLNGLRIGLAAALQAPRWGVLQWVTDTGLSLTPPPAEPMPAPVPVHLDQRAEVGNLTRNIVIQAPDDALWQNQGFGAHVMIMDLASVARVDGVEFRRTGQRGVLGRYPIHWHRLSYRDDGTLAGDATGHYVRRSSFNRSSNRCVTIHATNGLEITDNICFDIRGQAMFTEDAVERRNRLERNLVLRVRNPAAADALKQHDLAVPPTGGSSGFWISNPDNIVRGNAAADAEGFGFWLAFPRRPVGPSANVPIQPDRTLFGVFEDNVAHSTNRTGVMLDFAEINDQGNVFPNRYISTTDGQDPVWPFPNQRRFALTRVVAWKNRDGGIWDRVLWPDITECVVADNTGRFIAGAGEEGNVEHCLAIGTSLNASPRPAQTEVPTAFATYHSTFDLKNNLIVNFPLVAGERSGAFSTEDYYIRPVDKGHARNPGNRLIASHPGYRMHRVSPAFALAGALWDPFGTWGPAGNYSVYDDAFLTYGATCQAIPPALSSGAVSCAAGPFYGIQAFVLDQGNSRFGPTFPILATRLAPDLREVGTWQVARGDPSVGLMNMRHFAVDQRGLYRLEFPDSPLPRDVGLTIENLLTDADVLTMAVSFAGSEPAQVLTSTNFNYLDDAHAAAPDSPGKRSLVAVASRDALLASAGDTYWQDAANDLVWVKVRGGLQQPWNDADYPEFSDYRLYRAINLRIY